MSNESGSREDNALTAAKKPPRITFVTTAVSKGRLSGSSIEERLLAALRKNGAGAPRGGRWATAQSSTISLGAQTQSLEMGDLLLDFGASASMSKPQFLRSCAELVGPARLKKSWLDGDASESAALLRSHLTSLASLLHPTNESGRLQSLRARNYSDDRVSDSNNGTGA